MAAALTPGAAAADLGGSSVALWPHGIALVILAGLCVTGLAIVAALIAMRRLRSAHALQRDIFGAIPQPRQVVDSNGRTLLANKAFYEFFGNVARSMPELLLEEASDDDYACDQLQRLNANARNGTAGHLELRVRPRALGVAADGTATDGTRLDAAGAEWRYVVAYPISGRPGTVLWKVDDITLRRQMEQVIQEDHERFMDLLEFAPVGFYSVDADGYFLFANRTLCDWLGLSYEELDGGMIRLHDVLVAPPEGAVAPYESTGEVGAGTSEVRLNAADGGEFLASISQDLVTAQDGQVLRTRSVVRNLSRERALAEALERSVQRFKRFFVEAPVGIALLDADGQVTECNRAFAGLVGRQVEELATVSIFALVRDEDREEVRAALARAGVGDGAAVHVDAPASENILGAMHVPVEARLVGAAEKACAIYINRMTDTTGAARGFIAHLIDTTERKNLEVQFVQSQKMQAVGQLAGGIAHDFNNLLTAMIGFSDLLLLRHRPGDQSFADIMQIKQNANRAANLVRQLLAFSRQQTLQPRTLSVTDILAELSHLLRRLLGESIELEMVHGRDLHAVRADQVQLEQVIINLAVNARDAMADGGTLTIRTRNETTEREKKYKAEAMPPGEYVLIEVRDTGCGIAQEHRDRIFDPFFSTKEVGAGTGLGLSTVYGIVKQTGGFVFVDTQPGAGTLFSIYLPRAAAEAETGAAAEEEAGGRASRDLTGMGTVLLVEDEDAVRAFGARALRNKGYEVVEARSGDAALQVMEKQGDEIDILVTDVVMPQPDGPTLVRQVRETRPSLKVIFISGYTEDAFRQKLGEDEHIHFLPKPFSLKQLAAKVKEVMSEEAHAPSTAQRSSGA